MCLIVDVSIASLVFASSPNDDYVPILDWLLNRNGMLVLGGKNTAELAKVERAAAFVRQLDRAGRAFMSNDAEIVAEANELATNAELRSNDVHVIALARVSGARILCSNDGALIDDFKNGDLIANPRGKVYKRKEHGRLLVHTKSCPGRHLVAQRRRRKGKK